MNPEDEIIQLVADHAISSVEQGWTEIMINFKVDENQSRETNTYLISEKDKVVEKGIPYMPAMEGILNTLRDHVAQDGQEKFTECSIHFKATGVFEAKYSHDVLDWSLTASLWNFEVNEPGVKIWPLFESGKYDALRKIFDEDSSRIDAKTQELLFDTAIDSEDFEGLAFLLTLGYDINAVTYTGTPLSRASQTGSESLTRWLISHGAIPDVSSLNCNPLFCAVQGKNIELIRFYLAYGLDPSIRYPCGRDAIDFARIWSDPKVLELLGDDGSRPREPHVSCSLPDYSGFRPSEEMLAAVELELKFSLPQRLKDFLVHEFPEELFFSSTKDNDEWVWLGADSNCFHTGRSLIAYNADDPMDDVKRRKFSNYIVFGTDGGGNDYCLKTSAQEDKVWIHDHETEEFENTQMTLVQFTNALIENF